MFWKNKDKDNNDGNKLPKINFDHNANTIIKSLSIDENNCIQLGYYYADSINRGGSASRTIEIFYNDFYNGNIKVNELLYLIYRLGIDETQIVDNINNNTTNNTTNNKPKMRPEDIKTPEDLMEFLKNVDGISGVKMISLDDINKNDSNNNNDTGNNKADPLSRLSDKLKDLNNLLNSKDQKVKDDKEDFGNRLSAKED